MAPGGLIEREREVALLAGAVDACRQSRGGTVVIEGPGGIGKSSLLRAARDLAAEADFRVVTARGAELESAFPYGVVQQFFESFLRTVAPEERPRWMKETRDMAQRMAGRRGATSADPAEEFSLLHSLYWMCVSIADERPLMMVLDDAQWADSPSLRFVEFTIRRLDQLPLMFTIATRAPDDTAPAPLISVLGDPAVELIRPTPLSVRAVKQLVSERVDPQADELFARACHEATGGNPFLLGELLHEIVREQLPATAAAAEHVREIGPRGVSRMVLLRLRSLPEAARRLAAALSVAGDGMTLADLGKLAELEDADLREAATGLEQAELVELRDGVRFIHPIMRAAVLEDLSALERSELHRRAALLGRDQGHPDAEVAAHLLHVDAGGEPWVFSTLQAAASQAEAAGDFRAAIDMLSRARRERIAGVDEPELLASLGRVEARAGNPDGVGHLRAALAAMSEPHRLADVAIELANILKISGRADEAADLLLETLTRLDAPETALRRRLQAELLGTRFISAVTGARVSEAIEGAAVPVGEPEDLLDSYLLAASAFDAVATLLPAADVIRSGRPALSGRYISPDPVLGGQVLIVASVALIWAEDFDYVHERLSVALVEARTAGAIVALGNHSTMRAMCSYRAGRLLHAETDAMEALQIAADVEGLQTLGAPATAYAVLAGLERGRALEELCELAFDPRLEALSDLLPFTQLLWARGELMLASGEPERALGLFRGCNREDPGFGALNPAMVPWREGAALALSALGEEREARDLTADAVARARKFGTPRALGVALRAAALVADSETRTDGLRDAVGVLERSGSPLELARARCELGAVLRAAGRRTDAQAELERAHTTAVQLGAVRLAERSADELRAAGVRPRRELAGGLAALTPSERRVAELAAGGMLNREIAQALFVTEKTVETHLGHVYDKLGVRSRRKLPETLGLVTAA